MTSILSVLLLIASLALVAAYVYRPPPKLLSQYSKIRLFAKKISKADLRIKLIEDSKYGKKDEIVMFSRAMWLNVILPSKLGVQISEEEHQVLKKQAEELLAEELKNVTEFKSKLIDNVAVKKLSNVKIGVNGQLFGSVTNKAIIDHLKESLPDYINIINSKSFKIINILKVTDMGDGDEKRELVTEIRNVGNYSILIKAHEKLEVIELKLVVGE